MDINLRIAFMLFSIAGLLTCREVPKINWRAIAAVTCLLFGWIFFCVGVHPGFQP